MLRSGELPGQYVLEYYTDNTRRKLKGRIDLDQCDQVSGEEFLMQNLHRLSNRIYVSSPNQIFALLSVLSLTFISYQYIISVIWRYIIPLTNYSP